MLSIQTNVNSLIAQQNLNINNEFQSQTIQQLTSGYRINQSGDDAAGLSVANNYRNSVAELTQGVANGNDGVAQLQIMDGGMSNISQILDRLKTLATQSASGTLSGGDATRTTLNSEFQTDLGEIDRQAQSIGLNTNGSFVQSLDVYLGQGSGSQSLQNGIVTLDLSKSAVDSQALGLKGMDAVNATDIGDSSATSVQNIVSNTSGTYANQEAVAGYASLQFSGAGFADAGKAQVSVNLDGVTDVGTLVTAVNNAIQQAGQGDTAPATAFKNANIVATVNTDANGGQELAFTSSTAAFQVQAGDQMGNALLGNVSVVGAVDGVGGVAQGVAVTGTSATTVTGAVTTAGTFANTQSVNMVVTGGGLASPVTLNLDTSSTPTTSQAIIALENQFSSNSALQTAGLSMTGSSTVGGHLTFNSATGQSFNIQVTGDTSNLLGLGSYLAGNTGGANYNTITAGTSYSATAVTGNATTAGVAAGMEVSINGQSSLALNPIDLTSGTTSVAASVTGSSVGGGAVDIGATNDVLNMTVTNNGVQDNQVITFANTATVLTSGAAASSAITQASYSTVTLNSSNNEFMVAVDGGAATKVSVAAGTYTNATGTGSLLTAINTAISNAGLASKVTASFGANGTGALTLTSLTTGLSSSVSVTAATDATAGSVASGTLTQAAFPASITTSANNDSFMVSQDGAPAVKVSVADATYTTAASFLAAVTTALGNAGLGSKVSASWGASGTGALTFTSATLGASSSVAVTAATYGTLAAATSSLTTSGTTNNLSAAVTISAADHNNQFTVSVDGGATHTVTVADGVYTTATGTGSLLAAIQTAVSGDNLTASWSSGGSLKLTSAGSNTGTTSTVTIGAASQATAGVATSTLAASSIGGGFTVTSGTNDQFKIAVDGGSAVTVTVGSGTYTSATGTGSLLSAINTAISGTALGSSVTASFDAVSGNLVFSSATLGANSSVTLSAVGGNTGFTAFDLSGSTGSGSNAAANTGVGNLGLVAMTNTGATQNDGGLANFSLNSGTSTTAGLAAAANTGTTTFGLSGLHFGTNDQPTSLQSIATTIQAAFGANALVTLSNTNQLIVTSASKGANSSVAVNTGGANDASTLLGLNSPTVVAGQNMSLAEVINNLNSQFTSGTFQAAGLTATATTSGGTVDLVHPVNNTFITISSNNGTQFRLNSLGGASTLTHGGVASQVSSSTISVGTPIEVTTGSNDQFKIAVDGGAAVTLTVGSGTYTTSAAFLGAVQAAITANTSLNGKVTAGWNSTTNDLTLTSATTNTGAASSIAVTGVGGNTGLATFGFGTGVSGSGAQAAETIGFGNSGSTGLGAITASTGTSMSTQVASGVSNTTAINFTAMNYGSDKQALTFSAMDSNGVLETKTITLQNTTSGTNGNTAGASIDSAVAYINQQLQASTNLPALQQIVAVKQANAGGTAEQINFISKLSAFTVGVGASANADGLNGGVAATKASTTNGSSVNMSINTQAGAEQAITAITNAVAALGSAQAAVGKGENQLGYAINLAQSQITNFSAAESQIRDADVAAEAANLSKAQVLQQSTIAAMAQANSAPQAVLSLLKG